MKLITAFLTACLLASSAFSQNTPFFVTPGSDTVAQGQLVCVPVRVQGFNNLATLLIAINWDPQVLTFHHTQAYNLPDMDAGCSLEDSCPPDKFAAFRAEHPDHIALTYINCSTQVKALSDIIVTSSSAEKILAQIPKDQKIIFGPDRHLGGYLARKTGRDMLLWPGVCIVHEAFSETELLKLKAQHTDAPVAAHPECPAYILDHADYVGSTSGILEFSKTMPGDTLIVATEPHIIHQMEKAMPEKNFIGAPGADGNCNCNICPYMALNTLEKIYLCLRDLTPRIEIEEELRLAAKKSLDRMLELAAGTVGQGDLGAR